MTDDCRSGTLCTSAFASRRHLSAALAGPSGRDVDVVILNDAPPPLAHRALQGIELFTRDGRAYVRFFVRTMGELDDERHFHAVHLVFIRNAGMA